MSYPATRPRRRACSRTRPHQRSPAVRVLNVGVGAALEQESHARSMSLRRRHHQRRPVEMGERIDVRAVFDEQRHRLQMTRDCREHQGGPAVVVSSVDVSSVFKETVRKIQCTRLRRRHEAGLAIAEARIRVCARRKQLGCTRKIATLKRSAERFVDITSGYRERIGGHCSRQHQAHDANGALQVHARTTTVRTAVPQTSAEKCPASIETGRWIVRLARKRSRITSEFQALAVVGSAGASPAGLSVTCSAVSATSSYQRSWCCFAQLTST